MITDNIKSRELIETLEDYTDGIYEMANLQPSETGLSYSVWVDSEGKDRLPKHNIPRIKILVNNEFIPISISDDPEILVDKKVKNFREVRNWIIKNKEALLKHWNREWTDRQLMLYFSENM